MLFIVSSSFGTGSTSSHANLFKVHTLNILFLFLPCNVHFLLLGVLTSVAFPFQIEHLVDARMNEPATAKKEEGGVWGIAAGSLSMMKPHRLEYYYCRLQECSSAKSRPGCDKMIRAHHLRPQTTQPVRGISLQSQLLPWNIPYRPALLCAASVQQTVDS